MFRTLSLSLLLASSVGLANAQQVDDGGVSGTLTSASGTSVGNSAKIIFQVPQGNVFALTTACFHSNPTLSGSNIGFIAEGPPPVTSGGLTISASDCVYYTPGLALKPGEQIICQGGGAGGGTCVVTGVLMSVLTSPVAAAQRSRP
jgi:hypothetical protein